MFIRNPEDVSPEEVGGAVQESTVLKKDILDGDVGEQIISVNEIRFRPSERTKYHTHDYGQLLYVTEGEGIVATVDDEFLVGTGDFVFIPPGEVHWHGTDEEQTSDFVHFSIVLRDAPGEGTVVADVE